MNELDTLISGIDYKLRKLIEKLGKYEAEILRLKEENLELKKVKQEQSDLIQKLEEANLQHHLSRSVMSSKDATETKQRINELVREVDKCMALLNLKD
jgi:predicted RNase H-like nuclease (RuvC/YqgF family)